MDGRGRATFQGSGVSGANWGSSDGVAWCCMEGRWQAGAEGGREGAVFQAVSGAASRTSEGQGGVESSSRPRLQTTAGEAGAIDNGQDDEGSCVNCVAHAETDCKRGHSAPGAGFIVQAPWALDAPL